MPRAVMISFAMVAAGSAVLAAPDLAEARTPFVTARAMPPMVRTVTPARPGTARMLTGRRHARPDNVELIVKVLDTRPRNRTGGAGYATGNLMVHIEAAGPPRPGRVFAGRAGTRWVTRLPTNGAQSYSPPVGWKFSNLKVKIER